MDSIINYLGDIPVGAYEAIGAAIGISVLLQGIKKWLALQSEKVITFLLAALAFITSAIDYLLQTVSTNPSVLGQKTAMIVGLATLAYRFIVKPATNLVNDAKNYRANKDLVSLDDVESMNLLPVETVELPEVDTVESVDPVAASDF